MMRPASFLLASLVAFSFLATPSAYASEENQESKNFSARALVEVPYNPILSAKNFSSFLETRFSIQKSKKHENERFFLDYDYYRWHKSLEVEWTVVPQKISVIYDSYGSSPYYEVLVEDTFVKLDYRDNATVQESNISVTKKVTVRIGVLVHNERERLSNGREISDVLVESVQNKKPVRLVGVLEFYQTDAIDLESLVKYVRSAKFYVKSIDGITVKQ